MRGELERLGYRFLFAALLLLLLLHLLQIDKRDGVFSRLLGALDQYAPILGDGQLAVQRRGLFTGLDLDCDIEIAVGFAAEDPVRWRDISVIAANRGADMTVMGDEVVGGI